MFDLATALDSGAANPERVVEAFTRYTQHSGQQVTRAQFEQNLAAKLQDRPFTGDISPLLAAGFEWNVEKAAKAVSQLIALLPGDPWKGEG